MNFEPRSEEDIESSLTLPAGEYDFEVQYAEEKISGSGNEMIEIRITIQNGDESHTVMDWLVNSKAGLSVRKLRHFAAAVGLLDHYEAGELSDIECEGRTGRVRTRIQEDEQWGKQPRVDDYIVPDDYVPAAERRKQDAERQKPPVTDNMPF